MRLLPGVDVGGVGQAVLGKESDGVERSVRQFPVDLELALAFERNENPGLRGVEIQMTGLEVKATVGSDRQTVGKHAVVIAENFDRAGVFWLGTRGAVAARNQDRHFSGGIDTDLMRVDADV